MLFGIIATVLSGAASRLLNKIGSHRASIYSFLLIQHIVGAVVVIVWMFSVESVSLTVPKELLLPLVLAVIVWTAASLTSFIGIRHTEASVRESLIQSRLVFIPIIAVLFLGESVSLLAAFGTTLVLVGILIAVYRPSLSLAHPDMHGIQYVLLASLLIAVASTTDKYMVERMDYLLYAIIIYISEACLFFCFLNRERRQEIAHLARHMHGLLVLVAGVVTGIFYLLQLWLFQHLPLHIAYPIIQISSALTILLAIIFLRERERIPFKILGFVVAALGAFVLKMSM